VHAARIALHRDDHPLNDYEDRYEMCMYV
jgi:hypothetical protein